MTEHRTFGARRLRALAVAVAVSATALLMAAPSASGAMACNYDGFSFNACFVLERSHRTFSAFWYEAEVGLDRTMPVHYAREIISPPCNPDFRAELWGEDGATDQFIRPLQIRPGYPAITDYGLTVGFGSLAGPLGSQLDEDPGDNRDELYVKISYVDCHIGGRQVFPTTLIVGDYSNAGR